MKKLSLIIIIIIGILAIIRFAVFIMPMPSLDKFDSRQFALRYCDRHGHLLRWASADDGSWQTRITLSQVPPDVIRCVLLAEDRRYYWHHGTDIPAVIRSIAQNVTGKSIVSGASTITMQLSRMIWPHSGGMHGKITETLMAHILEVKRSKKWILEHYLNHIPFGYNAKGYAAAAEIYFGKALLELSPEEIAILCVIPRAPTKYNPFRNPDDVCQAASSLLVRMGRSNDATPAVLNRILSEMQTINRRFDAPHFVNHLSHIINEEIAPDKRSEIKQITSTLDLTLQQKVENIVAVSLDKYRESRLSNAAVIILNEHNEVITYIGSRDFFNDEISGQIDGVQIRNQPGSTLKPFLYAMAFDSSFTPDMILPDIPMNVGGEENYSPHNYNLRTNGPVRMRVALASSLNIPAVYLINRIGVQNFSRHLLNLGFDSLSESAQYPGLGLALGNTPVRLAELAAAFSVFGHGGIYHKPTYIRQITDSTDAARDFSVTEWVSPDYADSYRSRRIYSEETSFLIYDILSDEQARSLGFRNAKFFPGRKIAAKTGTSNQFGNIWAAASCPEYTIAVWGGNFNGNTIHGVPGAALPLAIVRQIVDLLDITPTVITAPDTLSVRPICALSGERPGPHCHAVVREYYDPAKQQHYETCSYHKISPTGVPYIAYPAEYVTWAANHKLLSPYQKYESGSQTPKIIEPTNGSIYYRDVSNVSSQSIRLRVSYQDQGQTLLWSVNGSAAQPLSFPYQTDIPLQPGIMHILVTNLSDSLHDEVQIMVK